MPRVISAWVAASVLGASVDVVVASVVVVVVVVVVVGRLISMIAQ